MHSRARKVPVLGDEDEAVVIEFVKNQPELYSKENARFLDKYHKEALWGQITKEVSHPAIEIKR